MLDRTSKWLKMAGFAVKIATWPRDGREKCTAWRQKIACSGTTVLRRHLAGQGPWQSNFFAFLLTFRGCDEGGGGGGGGGAGHRRFSIGSVAGVQMAENGCFCDKNRNVAAKR